MQGENSIEAVQAFLRDCYRRRALKKEVPAQTEGESNTDPESSEEEIPIWARPIFDDEMLANAPPEEEASFEGEALSPDVPLKMSGDPPDEGAKDTAAVVQEATVDDWATVERCFQEGKALKGVVNGWNKGGLLVTVGGLQGFVPSSQLLRFPRHLEVAERESFLARQAGNELELKVIELDREHNRLVLSERACIWPKEQGEALLEMLKSGDVVEGVVSNLCDFGAFVDLGGIDGLVHVSEISWQRVPHPKDALSIGDRVKVQVLNVDREHKRIGLSLKRLRQDPWKTIEQRYHVNQVVRGVITNVVDFGAFARIEEGVEGLIHVSELAEGDFLHPRNVVQEGDVVNLRILHIDGANHRLGLSLRRAPN